MKRLPIIISTMWFVAASIMAQNQKQFIVADKNGNSPLVQSLIFQQQDANERFSWKSESEADGYQADRDIKDLLFIARANAELATASSEDVTKMLEDLCGTDEADANAVSAALQNNPNIVEAFSEDGNNVAIRRSANEGLRFYPLYSQEPLFSERDFSEMEEKLMARAMLPRAKAGSAGYKIAVFNFFEGKDFLYRSQNVLVRKLISCFRKHGYEIHEFSSANLPPNNPKPFTQSALQGVCDSNNPDNRDYRAIFVFSHGALDANGDPCICTDELAQSNEDGIVEPTNGKAYKMISVKQTFTPVLSNCLVFLGACDSAPKGGYDTTDFSAHDTKIIGWSGRTKLAQAFATLLTYNMLYCTFGWKQIYNTFNSETKYASGIQLSYGALKSDGTFLLGSYAQFKYNNEISAEVEKVYHNYSSGKKEYIDVTIQKIKNVSFHKIHGYLVDLASLSVEQQIKYDLGIQTIGYTGGVDEQKFTWNYPKELSRSSGLYCLEIIEETGNNDYVRLNKPIWIIKSEDYQETGGRIVSEEDVKNPVILGTDGEPLDSICISVGSTETFTLDYYEGHILKTASLYSDIVSVSRVNNILTIYALSEGYSYIGIYDTQNKLTTVVKVIVTAGGDTPNPGGELIAYTSCPDDHHPHLIDLGLPSGTKWACCNVGASKPETRGEEYAWGETEYKNYCSLENYTLCPNGDVNSFPFYGDIAGTEYDIAHVKWGGKWQIPSMEHLKELVNVCSSEWTQNNGVNGRFFTGPNGGKIFLPAETNWGEYWSSNQITYGKCNSYTLEFDCYFAFDPDSRSSECYWGRLIRPIILSDDNVPTTDDSIISFADPKVKAVCVARWDTNGDGELSKAEASAVTSLDDAFKNNKDGITSFNELQYFTNLTSLGMGFTNCLSLISIIIPNSVLSFGGDSFFCCRDLVSINIPNRVSSIRRAFVGCGSLTSITIPKSVKKISERAFRNCSKLKQVHSYIEEPFTIDSSVFDGIPDDATLYVPAGCKAKYEATEGWNKFKNIVEME